MPFTQFNQIEIECRQVFIVENLMNFLTFPLPSDSIVIWDKGFHVELLRENCWLSNKPIYYWGDIDAVGFQILHRLRHAYPRVISFLMDLETYYAFEEQSVVCLSASYPTVLDQLNGLEKEAYCYVRE